MNIFAFDSHLEVPPEVLHEQNNLLDQVSELVEDVSLEDSQKEISDAVLEVVEETTLESRVFDARRDVVEEMMYRLLENEIQGLDHSKLEYGKVAEPLAIKWDYSQYEQDDRQEGKGIRFASEETISIEDVNKVIEEKAILDKLGVVSHLVDSTTKDMFKYYKLFNKALVKVKYDLVFS